MAVVLLPGFLGWFPNQVVLPGKTSYFPQQNKLFSQAKQVISRRETNCFENREINRGFDGQCKWKWQACEMPSNGRCSSASWHVGHALRASCWGVWI